VVVFSVDFFARAFLAASHLVEVGLAAIREKASS
jgi:hypothetical protein